MFFCWFVPAARIKLQDAKVSAAALKLESADLIEVIIQYLNNKSVEI